MVRAVRGAIFIENNTYDSIGSGVRSLLKELLAVNQIGEADIVSILFSQTRDLTEANPAGALRKDGFSNVPLFCTQEPEYKGAHPKVIRALVTFETKLSALPHPVYLNGAEKLRQDIFRS